MQRNKEKMLITGVSGLLGNNLAYYFRKKYNILGLFLSHPVTIEDIQTQKADILSEGPLKKMFQDFSPDIVVHCASLTNIDYCERNKEFADRVNVFGTKVVVDSIKDSNTKFVYISSDSVYDGCKGNFSEIDSVNPQNYYGLGKYKGELEALRKDNCLILRTNLFGWNIQKKHSIAEWILYELTQKRQITGFVDVYFSSIYTFTLAQILGRAIDLNLTGLFNCGSCTSLSKYEFALHLADCFNLDKDLIKPIPIEHYDFKAKRGKNLTLNVDKLQNALNDNLPSIREAIEAFYNDFKNGLPGKIRNEVVHDKTKPPFLYYGRQSIDEDDIQAVVEVLKSSNLTQGPKIPEFESALCSKVGALFAVAINSGTSALHAACLAAGVSFGHEVITSPNTFVASANCVVYCGARPVFADIDPETYNISPETIEKKITMYTRAIIPVHFAGQSCDMEAIQQVKKDAEKKYGHKIYIIEDACHALGSLYKNKKVGSCAFSDMAVMSFHPVKHITTGEGGVVFTNDESIYKQLRLFRSHGIMSDPQEFANDDLAFQPQDLGQRSLVNPWYYEQIVLGYNYRITDIQCALGLSQLKKLDGLRKRRREIVDTYNAAFRNTEFVHIPFEDSNCNSNFHLYVLLFDFEKIGIDRAQFVLELKRRGIQTQVHYIPVHLQSFYRKRFGTNWGDCPDAEKYYSKCLSIPLYPDMTTQDVERVIAEVMNILQGAT
jgi:perosamine synthetase